MESIEDKLDEKKRQQSLDPVAQSVVCRVEEITINHTHSNDLFISSREHYSEQRNARRLNLQCDALQHFIADSAIYSPKNTLRKIFVSG